MLTLEKDPVMCSLKHSLEELPVIPTLRKLRQKDSYVLVSRLCYTWTRPCEALEAVRGGFQTCLCWSSSLYLSDPPYFYLNQG